MTLNAIKQMETYARYHQDIVSLSQGIPYQPSDVSLRYAAVEALLHNYVDAYSDPRGILSLRLKISEILLKENMLYTQDEIIITAGATEGLMATLLCCITPEHDEIIIPTPTYSAYFKIAQAAKAKIVYVPLDKQNNWRLDPALLEKNISKKTAAILLCNPNNPTGSLYQKKDLIEICSKAQKYNIQVIIDEAYKNMIFDTQNYFSPCIENKYKKNIVRIFSFSKDFSFTGWRVAFLHSDKKIVEKILPFHDATVNCAPVISQYAAIAALENGERIVEENKVIYTKHRDLMRSYLDNLKMYLTYQMPQGSYYFFPEFRKKIDIEAFCFGLLRNGRVAVVPGNDFGPGGENHFRLCFGRRKEDIIKGMERLTRYLINNN